RVFGRRPMVACDVTVFPEPDSPTMQRISRALRENDTSLTANWRSAPAGNAIDRFRMSRTKSFPVADCASCCTTSGSFRKFRVQSIPEPVSKDVHPKDRQTQEYAGEEDHPRRHQEVGAA